MKILQDSQIQHLHFVSLNEIPKGNDVQNQSTTEDIFKKVFSKENFDQDQIIGKLEVIGLH